MRYLSLFSGIGGLDLGLDRAGMTCVGQVEKDPFCLAVLDKHWPEVPKHDDVHTAVEWWRSEHRPRVDAVVGGFPCQPVSLAGLGRAQEDERWLWPAMLAVVDGVRPEWVLWENTPGLITRGLDIVHADLEARGYAHTVGTASACEVGAPHPRKRVFGVAHAKGKRLELGGRIEQSSGGNQAGHVHHWQAQPEPHRVADGVPRRVDRNRALGNAVVPQLAEHIGRMVMLEVTADVDDDQLDGAA